MNKLLVIILIIGGAIISCAQTDHNKVVRPLLLDKSVLSGVGLEKIDLKDQPEKEFYQKNLFRGKDISVYVVSSQSWNSEMQDFPFDEFIYMYHGAASTRPIEGPPQKFNSGDFFFAPKGFTGEWEIEAGENLHYELSVISSVRSADDKLGDSAQHRLFNKEILSAVDIVLTDASLVEKVLEKGSELTVKLWIEKPSERAVKNEKEKLIHILSGQITLIYGMDEKTTLYAGDFMVIPDGYIGQWRSEGHGLVKYLTVEATH